MKHSIDYYIERVEKLLACQKDNTIEVTIDNTTLLVERFKCYDKQYIAIFSKYDRFGMSGYFYNTEDKIVTNVLCTAHYMQRFKDRYLKHTKHEGLDIWGIYIRRIVCATSTDCTNTLTEPRKRLKHIVRIENKKGLKRLVFVTCYRDNKLK